MTVVVAPERPAECPDMMSICDSCVTPGYCTKNNTCAQGKKLTELEVEPCPLTP